MYGYCTVYISCTLVYISLLCVYVNVWILYSVHQLYISLLCVYVNVWILYSVHQLYISCTSVYSVSISIKQVIVWYFLQITSAEGGGCFLPAGSSVR